MHGELSILTRGIEIYVSRKLADSKLVPRELFLLTYLFQQEGLKQEELAKHFMIDKGSVARTLETLEAKGLIRRYVNPGDRREKRISVTDAGLKLKPAAMALNREWHDLMLDGISGDDLGIFAEVLKKMSANISSSLKEGDLQNENKYREK